ncbi:hypothetical protein [Microbacterium amylolyticum]|uniref:Uncharacterized protein n=1 Tax=Microbacterium amylolyticum TaxID=936337 RepID=A0ABS4ZGW4_9MICO|nr:hypothetical protein [Microbacterium amylolyticum]MBP2436521.1 hypothetical protein [Microbacterium amylolyticum]
MALGGRSTVATVVGTLVVVAVVSLLVWAGGPFWPVVGEYVSGLFVGFFDWLRSDT